MIGVYALQQSEDFSQTSGDALQPHMKQLLRKWYPGSTEFGNTDSKYTAVNAHKVSLSLLCSWKKGFPKYARIACCSLNTVFKSGPEVKQPGAAPFVVV